MKKTILIRIFLWLALLAVVIFLLWMAVVPSGVIIYKKDFTKDNYFIQKFTPPERVETAQDGSQKITGGPVYFSLRTPRRFSKALLSVKYKNENEFPTIEAGVLVDKIVWRYNLQPLENNIINQISLAWDTIVEADTVFLQKEKNYETLNDFFNNPPDLNTVAVYNYYLQTPFILKDYEKSEEENILKTSLRGSYQFYTYIKDEDLNFSFSLLDLNENKNPDSVELYLYYDDERIDFACLEDDGITEDNKQASEVRVLDIKTVGLPEGVYKIELKAGDDIVTREIKAKQSKLSFINSIWLYRQGESEIDLYTNSKNIQARTTNPESLQTIKAGQNSLELNETYKLFSTEVVKASSTDEFSKISLEKDGVVISGNGVFCFSPASYLDPELHKADENLDVIGENIQYIIAGYDFPVEKDGWKTAQASFDLGSAYRENGTYSFLLSIPGLKADDEFQDYIEIDEIEIKLIGKSLKEKAGEIF